MSEPKEIWRVLDVGEKAIPGDQKLESDGIWRCISHGRNVLPCENIRHSETIPAWPAPRYDDPTKCGDGKRDILLWCPASDAGRAGYFAGTTTSWFDGQAWFEMPPAPVPQKTPSEIAWDERRQSMDFTNTKNFTEFEIAKREFLAGWKAKESK